MYIQLDYFCVSWLHKQNRMSPCAPASPGKLPGRRILSGLAAQSANIIKATTAI
jgi:hypothetical protein